MRVLLFGSMLFTGLMAFSQSQGDHVNLGLGLDGWGIPIYGSYDWQLQGDFNLGVGASLATGGSEFSGSAIGAGIFTQWYANRMLEIPSSFDAYAGLGLSYFTFRGGEDLDLRLFVGGRYYFDERMAVNLELGGGTAFSGGKIGISWRM